MNLKSRIIESLYFIGVSLFIIIGVMLKLFSLTGAGIYLLYTGRQSSSSIKDDNGITLLDKKYNLIWDLLFLGLSIITYFSVIHSILNLFFHNSILVYNQIIIYLSVFGVLYFEVLYRISLKKKNRIAAILILIILITSVGAFILGGYWLKTDLILGFLSLTVTVIISFRKAYLGLADILS